MRGTHTVLSMVQFEIFVVEAHPLFGALGQVGVLLSKGTSGHLQSGCVYTSTRFKACEPFLR